MLKGTVIFRAEARGARLEFPAIVLNPEEPSVAELVIEGSDGAIRSTIRITEVINEAHGIAIAERANERALDRISFVYEVAIEKGSRLHAEFSTLETEPTLAPTCSAAISFVTKGHIVHAIDCSELPKCLKAQSLPGEHHFRLYRSARQSDSHVEEFMHLYHMLLMYFDDKQRLVDSFIREHEPDVPCTHSPRSKPLETIYTRLRNEFAHERAEVNVNTTKEEMKSHLNGLASLVKKAIERRHCDE